MANRLISFSALKSFIAGGANMEIRDEDAARILLDGVSYRIERTIVGGELVGELADGLKQATVTGTYGIEDYGEHRRDVLLLRKHVNVISITSVTDDGSALDADDFYLDKIMGAVRLLSGGQFSRKAAVVDTVYTAGFTESGSGDARELLVPPDLRLACAQQFAHEWARRQPGGGGFGTNSVVTPGGSVIFTDAVFVKQVQDVIKNYKRPSY